MDQNCFLHSRNVGSLTLVPVIVFRVTSGNVVGVVERPETIEEEKLLCEQYIVKIGVLDRHGLLLKSDALVVIDELRRFVLKLFPSLETDR